MVAAKKVGFDLKALKNSFFIDRSYSQVYLNPLLLDLIEYKRLRIRYKNWILGLQSVWINEVLDTLKPRNNTQFGILIWLVGTGAKADYSRRYRDEVYSGCIASGISKYR